MKHLIKTSLLTTMALASPTLAQTPEGIAEDIAEGCQFRIQIKAGNEYVTVGNNGNILRWKELDDDDADIDNQRWVLHADGAGYRIVSVKNAEYMAVGDNGNILRWGNDPATQQFSFVDPDGSWISLIEPTNSERVAVGFDGNVLRWKATNGDEQKFKFRRISSTCTEAPDPEQRETADIGDPPPLTSAQIPARQTSAPELISTEYVPAALVKDPAYQNLVLQIDDTPFYRLERHRYWTLAKTQPIRAQTTFTKVETVSSSYESTQYREQTDTVSFRGEYTGQIQGKASAKAAEVSATHTLKATFEKSSVSTVGSSQTTSQSQSDEVTVNFPTPLSEDLLWVTWQLVDEYRLFRGKRSKQEVWSKPVIVPTRLFFDAYPKSDPNVVNTLAGENRKLDN